MGKGGIHCGSIYCFSEVNTGGIDAQSNVDLLNSAAFTINSLVGPWIVGGDWNCTPAELKATGWLKRVNGVAVAPSAPTCNDSAYDYFVVHQSILHLVHSVHRVADAELWPHSPARLILKGRSRKVMVRQIEAPFPCPANLPYGPLNEHCYHAVGDPLHDWNMTINQDYNDLTKITTDILKHISGVESGGDNEPPRLEPRTQIRLEGRHSHQVVDAPPHRPRLASLETHRLVAPDGDKQQ